MNNSVSDLAGSEWTVRDSNFQGPIANRKVDHGILDEKGRRVGGTASIFQVPADSTYWPSLRGQFMLEVGATRDGRGYGASSRGTVYPDLTRAVLAAIRKLE